jgi:hypothetical protein
MRYLVHLWQTIVELTHRDFWWAEFFSALALMIWALVNIENPEALSSHNFWPLLQVAPESFWERASLCVGTMQLIALAADNRWARAFGAFLATWLVGCIFGNLMHLGHWPTGAVGYYFAALCTSIMALWKNIIRHGSPT